MSDDLTLHFCPGAVGPLVIPVDGRGGARTRAWPPGIERSFRGSEKKRANFRLNYSLLFEKKLLSQSVQKISSKASWANILAQLLVQGI